MSRDDPILRVRVPEELRVRLKALASENRRSMNAEIVDRLEQSLADHQVPKPNDSCLVDRLEAVEKAMIPDFTAPSFTEVSENMVALRAEMLQLRKMLADLNSYRSHSS